MDETSDTFCGATGGAHQVKEWTVTVEPSCMVGLREGYCEACQMMCNDVIPATGEHLWDKGTVTTAPTCEGEGVKTYNCIMCNDATKTEPSPPPATVGTRAWRRPHRPAWMKA